MKRFYKVIFETQDEGGYTVSVPALPGCFSEGDTYEEALKNIREAIDLYLESLAADGMKLPDEKHLFVEIESSYDQVACS